MNNENAILDNVVFIIGGLGIFLIAIVLAGTFYPMLCREHSTAITVDQKFPATYGFASNVPAYITTTDGDIFSCDDIVWAKLKEGSTYNIKYYTGYSGRTGKIISIEII